MRYARKTTMHGLMDAELQVGFNLACEMEPRTGPDSTHWGWHGAHPNYGFHQKASGGSLGDINFWQEVSAARLQVDCSAAGPASILDHGLLLPSPMKEIWWPAARNKIQVRPGDIKDDSGKSGVDFICSLD
jgi:hypothetical protein